MNRDRKDSDDPGIFRKPFCVAEMQGKGQRKTHVKLKSPVGSRIPMAMGCKLKSSWRATEGTLIQRNDRQSMFYMVWGLVLKGTHHYPKRR